MQSISCNTIEEELRQYLSLKLLPLWESFLPIYSLLTLCMMMWHYAWWCDTMGIVPTPILSLADLQSSIWLSINFSLSLSLSLSINEQHSSVFSSVPWALSSDALCRRCGHSAVGSPHFWHSAVGTAHIFFALSSDALCPQRGEKKKRAHIRRQLVALTRFQDQV